ncbi:autotransporter outer membrane beta-barrel domain-containing protein [Achromobacter xylosoxidans]
MQKKTLFDHCLFCSLNQTARCIMKLRAKALKAGLRLNQRRGSVLPFPESSSSLRGRPPSERVASRLGANELGTISLVLFLSTVEPALAQTVGPGNISSTVNVGAGTTTMVGGTNVSTATGAGVQVSGGGTLIIDPSAGPSPGSVSIQTAGAGTGDSGIHLSGPGALTVDSGVTISTTGGGHGVWLASTAATAQMIGTSITTTGNGALGFLISASGSTASLDRVTIRTSGANAYGVALNNGAAAAIDLKDSSISTTGAGADGLMIATPGNQVNMQRVTITTVGAVGIRNQGGSINISDSSVSTQGAGGIGIAVLGGAFTGNSVSVTTSGLGGSAIGMVAQGGAQVSLARPVIRTLAATGILVDGTGTTLSATDVDIATTNGAGGVSAQRNAQVSIVGGRIETAGVGNLGVVAVQGGGVSVEGAAIQTRGDNAFGLVALLGSSLQAKSTSVATQGSNAAGVLLGNSGSVFTGENFTVTTGGGNAPAVALNDGATLTLRNATLTTTGASSSGFVSGVRSAPTAVNTAEFSNVTLASAQSESIAASGGVTNLRFDRSDATANNGRWLNVTSTVPGNPTTLNLSADASRVQGAAAKDAASVSNISFSGGSTWILTGDSSATSLTNNASQILFSASQGTPSSNASYKTLTLSNYSGTGGSIALNTFLAGDGAPSDRVVIDGGSATGSTALRIANSGGGGELTTGDGILVVDARNAASTQPGAFTLGDRVAAGAFEYSLFRGGSTNGESYYLRSTVIDPEVAPLPPEAPANPADEVPNYREEVPLNMAVPLLAARYGLGMLGTYHDRAGAVTASVAPEDGTGRSSWARLIGETGRVGGSGFRRFENDGPSYHYDLAGFQLGQDLYRRQGAEGARDIVGAYFGVASASADVNAVFGGRAGKVSMNGTSLGVYWTRQGSSGWYADGVLQGTIFSDIKTRSNLGQRLSTDGTGLAASLEVGYPFDLGGNWALEPQGQLIYQYVSIDSAKDDFGRVKFDDIKATYARLGARLKKQMNTEGGAPATGWLRVNVWQQMGADSRTSFSGLQGGNAVTLASDLGGTWAQVGVGVSGQLSKRVSVFAAADYNQSLNHSDGQGVSGRLGLAFRW